MRLPLLGLTVLLAFAGIGVGLVASLPSHSGAAAPLPPLAGHAAVTPAAAPLTASHPASFSCSTPASTGVWGTTDSTGRVDFFKSVKVSFYVPNDPALSGSNFNVTPCNNVIPTYVQGFWMNISTDVQIQSASVTIWGLSWSLPTQQFETPIPGYSPGVPYDTTSNTNGTVVPMYVTPPLLESASFYFNDYKNFWPGDQVFFNVSVTALNASPAIITSSGPSDNPNTAPAPGGTDDLPNWEFLVQAPWTSNNFTQDVGVSTIPNVLGNPSYDPNPSQPLQIILSAINVGTGTTLSIPAAVLTLSVCPSGCVNGASVYGANFGPLNHSVETIVDSQSGAPRSIGPFAAGSVISFNISAWVPWEGGIIDRIYSPTYTFTWSKNGTWWSPNSPLEQNHIELTTDPAGINATPQAYPTMTPVNVTIHETLQNVTIGAATVVFQYHDRVGTYSGKVVMNPVNLNTSYYLIPGLPPGGNLTFSVLAKDIRGNVIASSNYSYYETGDLAVAPAASTGYLFFEAVDLTTSDLYANAPFTLSNSTWSESGNITPFGFGGILPPAGVGFLPLSYGVYTLSVNVAGTIRTASVNLTLPVANPTVFYYASESFSTLNTVQQAGSFPIAGSIGIIGAAVTAFPVYDWFKERRKKAEAEQKRITL